LNPTAALVEFFSTIAPRGGIFGTFELSGRLTLMPRSLCILVKKLLIFAMRAEVAGKL
jgi:hypothetical protein